MKIKVYLIDGNNIVINDATEDHWITIKSNLNNDKFIEISDGVVIANRRGLPMPITKKHNSIIPISSIIRIVKDE